MTESDEECYCGWKVWTLDISQPEFMGKSYNDLDGEWFNWKVHNHGELELAVCSYHHHELLFQQLRETTDLFL